MKNKNNIYMIYTKKNKVYMIYTWIYIIVCFTLLIIGVIWARNHMECFRIIETNGMIDTTQYPAVNVTIPKELIDTEDKILLQIKTKPEVITGEVIHPTCAEKVYPYYIIARWIVWIGWPIMFIIIYLKYKKEIKEILKGDFK